MKFIIDAFGGDNAPLEIIKGCILAKAAADIEIALCGDENLIKKCAKDNNLDISTFEIIPASQQITMHDEPTDLLKAKSDSSMAVGMKMLSQGHGDAFASAGNSGALVVGTTMIVKRIKGVKRVTFASVIPKQKGFFMLSDVGANTECRPDMLLQFAIMGSVYMEKVMGIKNPRVGLLNVGTEEHKGTPLYQDAFKLLKANEHINFVGNVEGRDMVYDAADVVVCDGFTGNITLKVFEGVALSLMGKIKGVFTNGLFNKLAAAIVLKDMKRLKKEIDYNEYGGAPIMGASKPVFKIHGSAKAETVKSALMLMKKYIDSGVIHDINDAVKSTKNVD